MRSLLEKSLAELKKNIHWSRKAVVISVFHNVMLLDNPKWTVTNTAKELEISKAYASECIMLANKLSDDMTRMSRRVALRLVKGSKT
jgi:hypothetical protein